MFAQFGLSIADVILWSLGRVDGVMVPELDAVDGFLLVSYRPQLIIESKIVCGG